MEYFILEDDADGVTSYGVALKNSVYAAPQLTDDRAAALRLVQLLNELQVEPCHFEDVIEDYLTDFSV